MKNIVVPPFSQGPTSKNKYKKPMDPITPLGLGQQIRTKPWLKIHKEELSAQSRTYQAFPNTFSPLTIMKDMQDRFHMPTTKSTGRVNS